MNARLLPWAGSSLLLCASAGTLYWATRTLQAFELPEIPPPAAASVPATDTETDSSAWNTVRRPAVYYAAITDRPLFAPLRRPAAPDDGQVQALPQAEAAPTADLQAETVVPVFTLHGTMAMADTGSALIGADDQPPEWLSVGGSIAGFTLNTVGPDWAQLSSSKTELKLDLYPK